MRLLVTGVAGFIGSSTAERLLADGRHQVIGIDSMRENYDIAMKMANLNSLRRFPRFEYVPGDLRTLDLRSLFDAADAVYHLAAVAGVRDSWADNFAVYLTNNVQATQQVLEAALATGVPKVVYASSSSAYGNAARYPVTLDTMTRPQSPYGVTKLAGEHLCSLYASNHGVNAVSLRYFTVYGPRQRPDMAIHRMIEAGLAGDPFHLFGNGEQRRDFTFVDDVVRANISAAEADTAPGTVLNVAGGSDISMIELLKSVGRAVGQDIDVRHEDVAVGDVVRTGGEIDRTTELLGWVPEVGIEDGLSAQVAWHRRRAAIDLRPMAVKV